MIMLLSVSIHGRICANALQLSVLLLHPEVIGCVSPMIMDVSGLAKAKRVACLCICICLVLMVSLVALVMGHLSPKQPP